MSRIYSIPFSAVAVSAAQDLFEIKAATAKPFILHEIVVGQSSDFGDAQAEGLGIQVKRAAGTYTTGSGGSTSTPIPSDSTVAAAGATAKINNTTQASAGTGTLTVIRADCFNVQSGYSYRPSSADQLLFYAAQACVVSITAPADALTMSGTAVIEEIY